MYLEKLPDQFDIEKLQNEVKELLNTYELCRGQISLNHRHGYVDQCWTDGCGSPYSIPNNIHDNLMENLKSSLVPRFIENDFIHINPTLEGTEIEKIYSFYSATMTTGRYRIAMLQPKSCYGWHYDLEKRIHIPVITNSGSFIITDDGKATHLPATGEAWMFNANNGYHTAMNASYDKVRAHLLLSIL